MRRNTFEGEQTEKGSVPTDADTQLGAFGPGADPTRSKAVYPPPHWLAGYVLIDSGQKILFLGGTGNKILPSGVQKYKILIFGGLGTDSIDY